MTNLSRATAILLALFCFCPVHAQENQGFDLVTMRNGDIFTGNLVLDRFDMGTDFGHVSIPKELVSKIEFTPDAAGTRIHTLFGDRFGGTLGQPAFTMLRVLDPPLPLDVADIAEIRIGPGKKMPTVQSARRCRRFSGSSTPVPRRWKPTRWSGY